MGSSFTVEWESDVDLGEPDTGKDHVHVFVDGNSNDYTVVGGDSFEVTVESEQAYGPRREGFTQRVPKKHFREARLRPGQEVMLNTSMGPRPVTVLKVGATVVDVDLNHPMAGKALQFQVEIVDVREAEPVEIEHGHVHGEGGAQH